MSSKFTYDGEEITVGNDNWKEYVLSADPFEGDMDGGHNLTDKIVKARKTFQLCSDCLSVCIKGTFNRVIKTAIDGTILTNRYCEECCTAMGFGEDLFEGNKQLDDDAWEDACTLVPGTEDTWLEPQTLQEIRWLIREENENHLVEKLGAQWHNATNEQQYNAMWN